MLRTVFSFGVGAGLAFSTFAAAKTIVSAPDPCPAYVNAPLIIDIGPIEDAEYDPALRDRDGVLVIYAPIRTGWARQYLLARYDVEVGGEPLNEPPAGRPCFRRSGRH